MLVKDNENNMWYIFIRCLKGVEYIECKYLSKNEDPRLVLEKWDSKKDGWSACYRVEINLH